MRRSPSPSSASNGACPRRIPTSPSQAGATTCSAGPSKMTRSGLITETCNVLAMLHRQSQLFARFNHVSNTALHVERLLREVVELAFHHPLERFDRVLQLHVFTFVPG